MRALLCVALVVLQTLVVVADDEVLAEALTFHASFDRGVAADFALGDGALYTVMATKPEVVIEKGLHAEGLTVIAVGEGRFGNALEFTMRNARRIFFKTEKNLPYSKKDWSGTVSAWLRVSPDEDLEPGYTDPIQITPRSALDGCFFCEFGIEDPRPFRLGVFADAAVWNPEGVPTKEIPISARPLIEVERPPFSRDRWTHVVFTFEKFNSGGTEGVATLYLDGEKVGEMRGRKQQFTWEVAASQLRLGVNFVGMIDEVSCFDRALSAAEVARLQKLPEGVKALVATKK